MRSTRLRPSIDTRSKQQPAKTTPRPPSIPIHPRHCQQYPKAPMVSPRGPLLLRYFAKERMSVEFIAIRAAGLPLSSISTNVYCLTDSRLRHLSLILFSIWKTTICRLPINHGPGLISFDTHPHSQQLTDTLLAEAAQQHSLLGRI